MKNKELRYHGEKYAKLEDGTIEPLYYDFGEGVEGTGEPRMFYYDDEDGCWYLDQDKFVGFGIALCHCKIKEFLNGETDGKID